MNSGNIKFPSYSEVNEVANELFKSLCSKYQKNLETSMKWSDLVFGSIQLMFYKCRKVNFKWGDSNIGSTDWIKKRKATINPKNERGKCFQYVETVALNYEEIEPHLERV